MSVGEVVSYTIERRYIGTTEGTGLLDRWHIPWLEWHVYQSFDVDKDRDKRLKQIVNDAGWHVDNFEYRKGGETEIARPAKKVVPKARAHRPLMPGERRTKRRRPTNR